MHLARRLAITLLVPALLLFVGEHVLLPGITGDILGNAGGSYSYSNSNVGVFALWIQPILSAYWIVEVISFLVPRWSRLRHGGPEGRAKLDRASRVLTLLLAAVQGVTTALSLKAMGDDSGTYGGVEFSVSVPLVTVSLVGGVCILFMAARLISKHGLLNGFIALFGAGLLRTFVHDAARALGLRSLESGVVHEPRDHVTAVVGVMVAAVATWAALRGAGRAPDSTTEESTSRSPYRSARWLAVHPWIPVPASSFQPYFFASGLLALPATLANLGLPFRGVFPVLHHGDAPFILVFSLVMGGAVVVFATLMHRPAELADLATRLGAGDGDKLRAQAREALRRAILPTFLFLLAVLLSPALTGPSTVVMLTMIVMDLVQSLRTERSELNLVPVWEEWRAPAVPILRAALAADGIATETRGMAVLSLWQVFAPYAPAQLLVKRDDAERATKTLRHLLLSDEAPDRTEARAQPWRLPSDRWTLSRRTMVLGACAVAAGLLRMVDHLPLAMTPREHVPRAKLEVVRVDDTIDPFADVREEEVPEGQGISVYQENAPAGPGNTVLTHFVRIVLHDGEATTAAIARVKPWLSTIPLPPGARFGFEEVVEYDEETRKATPVGARTLVLSGDPVLRTEDITEAVASIDSSKDGPPDAYVAVTLGPDGAKRFAEATRQWTQRRIAILVDDQINSAPVVRTTISGGRVSITIGRGDPEQQIADAKKLARALGGR